MNIRLPDPRFDMGPSSPASMPRHQDEPHPVRSLWGYSDTYRTSGRNEDEMEMDTSYQQQDQRTPRRPNVENVITLSTETTADKMTRLPALPASPAWSQSSMASDGTSDSNRIDYQSSSSCSDGSSGWLSPLTQCSSSNSFSTSCSSQSSSITTAAGGNEKSLPLPRLPELDLISLETLASHYASSTREGSRRSPCGSSNVSGHSRSQSQPQSHFISPPNPFYEQPYQRVTLPLPSATGPNETDPRPLRQRPRRSPPTRGSRCNIKYTIEQKDFIDYWRIDRQDRETPWDDVVREFNRQFKGPHRRNGGLQSAYYRENKKIPVTDRDGMLVFDAAGEIKTIEVPVREAKGKLHSIKAIGLLATHPERAIRYPWVSSEHKRKIWRIAQARQAQLDAAMQQRVAVEGRSPSENLDGAKNLSSSVDSIASIAYST